MYFNVNVTLYDKLLQINEAILHLHLRKEAFSIGKQD